MPEDRIDICKVTDVINMDVVVNPQEVHARINSLANVAMPTIRKFESAGLIPDTHGVNIEDRRLIRHDGSMVLTITVWAEPKTIPAAPAAPAVSLVPPPEAPKTEEPST